MTATDALSIARIRRGLAGSLVGAWRRRDVATGRRVEVRGPGERYVGRALGVDAAGRLVVRDSRGDRHTLTPEEVRSAG